jgi:hypothetical protein
MALAIGSHGARRGGGVAMKREEDEMSVSFSVREEDEQEEEAAEAEVAEDEAKGRAKRGWPSERRWDGMEMGGGYGYRLIFFSWTHADPRRRLFLLRPQQTRHDGL